MDLTLSEINTNSDGIPYLTGASCFVDDGLLVNRWTNIPKTISHKNDLLITVKGTIGELAFNNIGEIHIARQIMSLTINKEIEPQFIFFYLLVNKEKIIQKKASLIPGIKRDDILNLVIAIPPKEEQKRIILKINELLNIVKKISNELKAIRDLTIAIKRKTLDYFFGDNSSYKSYYEKEIDITEDVIIFDNLRKPINHSEREKRLLNSKIIYPYYGATGQVGSIDDYIFDGEYVLLGEDGAPFLDKFAVKAYLIVGKSWVNNHVHVLKSKSNNKFLMYYLNWIDYTMVIPDFLSQYFA